MRICTIILLVASACFLGGCNQSSTDYSKEMSSEVPKPREGAPSGPGFTPMVRPGQESTGRIQKSTGPSGPSEGGVTPDSATQGHE